MATPSVNSHLFTVRLWTWPEADDQTEWRGKVTHVLSGETRYFREWQELVDHLRAMLATGERSPSTDDGLSSSQHEWKGKEHKA
jgi:hypothetical protein